MEGYHHSLSHYNSAMQGYHHSSSSHYAKPQTLNPEPSTEHRNGAAKGNQDGNGGNGFCLRRLAATLNPQCSSPQPSILNPHRSRCHPPPSNPNQGNSYPLGSIA